MTGPAYEVLTFPDREAWLKARMDGFGASDAAAVFGVSPWKTSLALYAEKLGLEDASVEETEAMEWGTRLESAIATKYAEETKRPLRDPGRFTIHRSLKYPFMQATLDREVLLPNEHHSLGALEIKTTGAFKAEEWAEEPPLMYQLQLQQQLAVVGHAWGSLAVLIGGQKFLWVDMPRNDRIVNLLIEREGELWERIQRMDPPTPRAEDKALLAAIYGQDSGETVELPVEAVEWDRRRAEAAAQIKHHEAIKDEMEALLRAAMKDATFGVLPGGIGRYSWKSGERAGYAVPATKTRTLRRLAK